MPWSLFGHWPLLPYECVLFTLHKTPPWTLYCVIVGLVSILSRDPDGPGAKPA